jgi:hypothetical protein
MSRTTLTLGTLIAMAPRWVPVAAALLGARAPLLSVPPAPAAAREQAWQAVVGAREPRAPHAARGAGAGAVAMRDAGAGTRSRPNAT